MFFLPKTEAVLLLLTTSSVLFQSMLPLNDIAFVPKDAVDVLGRVQKNVTYKQQEKLNTCLMTESGNQAVRQSGSQAVR